MRTERKNVRKKFFPNGIGQKMLHEKSCGAVLFTTEKEIKKFLLVESNYFGFPKGHVEENETEQETALREIKEETGVDAKIIPGFRETVNYKLPNGNVKEVVFFIAEYAPQPYTVNRTELRGITLLTYDKAIKRITYPDTRNVLKDANEWLKRHGY